MNVGLNVGTSGSNLPPINSSDTVQKKSDAKVQDATKRPLEELHQVSYFTEVDDEVYDVVYEEIDKILEERGEDPSSFDNELADRVIDEYFRETESETSTSAKPHTEDDEKSISEDSYSVSEISEDSASEIAGKSNDSDKRKAVSTNAKVQNLSLPFGKSESSSSSASNALPVIQNRSFAWRLYKSILKCLPRGSIVRAFSNFAVRDGRLEIKDIEPKLIPKLSPRLFHSLSKDQIKSLKIRQLGQLNEDQLFAIDPKLELLGPEKMAFVISNKLAPQAQNNFMKSIVSQYERGNLDKGLVRQFFEKMDSKELTNFLTFLEANNPDLISSSFLVIDQKKMAHIVSESLDEEIGFAVLEEILKSAISGELDEKSVQKMFGYMDAGKRDNFFLHIRKTAPDSFREYYPLAFAKKIIHVDVDRYMAEILHHPSVVEKSEQSMEFENSDGSASTITPYKSAVRDMHRGRFIINGEDFDPEGRLRGEAKAREVLERINSATSDPVLTEKIQALISGPDAVQDLTRVVTNEFNLDLNVFPAVNGYYFNVNVDSSHISIDVIMNLEIKNTSTDRVIGYSQAIMKIGIPSEDFKAERMDRAVMNYIISPIFPDPPDKLEAGATFDYNAVYFERKAVFEEGIDEGRGTPPDPTFVGKQQALRKKLEKKYSDANAIKYAAARLDVSVKHNRAMEYSKILKPLREGMTLEDVMQGVTEGVIMLDILNEIVENASLQENATKDTLAIAKDVTDNLKKINLALKTPNTSYALSPKFTEALVRRDEEEIQRMLLERIEANGGKDLDEPEITQIKKELAAELGQIAKKDAKRISKVEKELESNEARLEEFKEEVLEIMKEVNVELPSGLDEKQIRAFRREQREKYDQRIAELKEKYNLEPYRTGESDLATDVMELFLDDVSHSFTKILVESKGESRLAENMEKKLNEAKLAFYEARINFPDRAKIYADILVDQYVKVSEAYS